MYLSGRIDTGLDKIFTSLAQSWWNKGIPQPLCGFYMYMLQYASNITSPHRSGGLLLQANTWARFLWFFKRFSDWTTFRFWFWCDKLNWIECSRERTLQSCSGKTLVYKIRILKMKARRSIWYVRKDCWKIFAVGLILEVWNTLTNTVCRSHQEKCLNWDSLSSPRGASMPTRFGDGR